VAPNTASRYQLFVLSRFDVRRRRWARAFIITAVPLVPATVSYISLIARPRAHTEVVVIGLAMSLTACLALCVMFANLWSTILLTALYVRVFHERLLEALRNHRRYKSSEWGSPDSDDAELDAARRDLEHDFTDLDLNRKADVDDLKDIIGRLRLFGRACGFCGAPHAPIICPTCHSIQYGDLARDNLTPHMPKWHWTRAVFLGRYRWELLAAVIPASLAGVIVLTQTALAEARRTAAEHEEKVTADAERFITATISYRWALEAFESRCRSETKEGLCDELFQRMYADYMQFSWYGDSLLSTLNAETCETTSETGSRAGAACAYLAGRGSPIDKVDEFFDEYVSKINHNDTSRHSRRLAAYNLFHAGRLVSCIVTTLHWQDGSGAVDNDCTNVLQNGWTNATALPDCDERTSTGSWGCWDY
jgi:hypothetical protein